jgi:hypothetical protein
MPRVAKPLFVEDRAIMGGRGKRSDWASASANLRCRMVARNEVRRNVEKRGRRAPDYEFVLAIREKFIPDGADRAWL